MPTDTSLSHDQALQLLTPAMRQLVTRIERAKRPPLYTLPADQARAAHDMAAGLLDRRCAFPRATARRSARACTRPRLRTGRALRRRC
jgi:hypothetical protein